jgi:hypothetical protein
MHPLVRRFREFYPGCVAEALVRRTKLQRVQLWRTPCSGMAEDALSGFLDYTLSLPLCGILRSSLEMTGLGI